MSTRCNIVVKEGNKKVYLYHHCDGYPSGVGIDLLDKNLFNKWYYDISYIVNKLIKATDDDGYEYTSGIHGDIEYLYVINVKKKEIKCYKVSGFDMKYNDIVKKENEVIIQ